MPLRAVAEAGTSGRESKAEVKFVVHRLTKLVEGRSGVQEQRTIIAHMLNLARFPSGVPSVEKSLAMKKTIKGILPIAKQ